MSNSASRKGGATLFFTTFTRVRLPTTSSPSLMARDAPHVEAHRGVELERVAAGGGLGVAEHHADLHADLVDEDDGGARLRDRARELAQRLAHQPRLQAHVRVAHLALDLGPRHQRRHRVDDDQVDRARAHQHVGDLERLLAGVGLGDQQVVDAARRAGARSRRRARARRRRRPPRRPRAAPRRRRAAPAWSCRSTPGRRSRPRGRAGSRRCRARGRGSASRCEKVSISRSMASSLIVRIAPLPNCFSIDETASSIAFSLVGLRRASTAVWCSFAMSSVPPMIWFQG